MYQDSQFGKPIMTAGRYGYAAYRPLPIPRLLELDSTTVNVLADAEAALGRLAGAGRLIANPHLLITSAVRKEALSSTRIEGTQVSLPELLRVEARGQPGNADIEEVINYIRAAKLGTELIRQLPISKRMLRELHQQLLDGVRGAERNPGEFRTSQNWIGEPGATIETASFVPPPVELIDDLLDDWEKYANEEGGTPVLVRCAVLHYQLETIHPFLDGNGRLGRLLVVLYLLSIGRLPSPILYLSTYLEGRRDEYYRSLQLVRETGNVNPFLQLFFRGIEMQSNDAVSKAEQLIDLREKYRRNVGASHRGTALELAELIVETPVLTSGFVERRLGVSKPTALKALRDMEQLGILAADPSGGQQILWIANEVISAVGDQPTVVDRH